MFLFSAVVMVIIYIILSLVEANYLYALCSLVVIPLVVVALRISKKRKITVYSSAANDFVYEIDNDFIARPHIISGIVEFGLFIIFLIISILEMVFVKIDSDNVWMKDLFGIQLGFIALATVMSCNFNYKYPKKLTNKVLLDDKICAIGFYLHLTSLIIFIVLMIEGIYGGIVVFFDIPLVISSLVVYIMSKFYLSKYKLYEYIFDKKTPFEQNKNNI